MNGSSSSSTDELVQRYESVSFEDMHRAVLRFVPQRPSRVLDVGAGPGRDAAALAGRGHEVVAVEPSASLRRAGQTLYRDLSIAWLDDRLPDLPLVCAMGRLFDLVLLSAVWSFLDKAERTNGMRTLADLLAPEGVIILTLRHGPSPTGRRAFAVGAEEVIGMAAVRDLRQIHVGEREDVLGRSGVGWSDVVLTNTSVEEGPRPSGREAAS